MLLLYVIGVQFGDKGTSNRLVNCTSMECLNCTPNEIMPRYCLIYTLIAKITYFFLVMVELIMLGCNYELGVQLEFNYTPT